MPIYKQVVNEVRNYRVEYTVEAKDIDEAKEKLANGDTQSEIELGSSEVMDRHFHGEPEEVPEGDDVCDKCMRSGVEVSQTDANGNTVCTDCAE